MMKRTIYVVFVSLFCLSCSESDLIETMNKTNDKGETSYKVTSKEAQVAVLNFLEALENDTQTKSLGSSSRREIANVKALCRNTYLTRSNEKEIIQTNLDTLMYVVNFSNNNGFAFVAADKRTDPIYAIVDEGNYDFENLEEEENEGLLSFLDYAIATELEDVNNYQEEKNTRAVVNGWTIHTHYPPILKTKWSQGGYNNPNSFGKYCPNKVTGCTVTATAQILSHFKTIGQVNWSYNGTYGRANLNWQRIISDSERYGGYLSPTGTPQSMDEIAHLCRYLGVAFGAKYNVNKKNQAGNSTSVGEDKPIDWFNKWGGLRATKLKKYDEAQIISTIKKGNPVYARGNSGKKKFLGIRVKYKGGHAWVYDGYISATKNGKQQNLIHCNWGWSGSSNGYYLSRVFQANVGPEIYDSAVTRSGQANNYRYNLEYSIITK